MGQDTEDCFSLALLPLLLRGDKLTGGIVPVDYMTKVQQ